MRGLRLLAAFSALFLLTANKIFSQSRSVTISGNPGLDFAPFASIDYNGYGQFSACESIYTSAEIGGSTTFGANPINRIEFDADVIGTNPNYGNVKIYMKNIGAATTAFSGNGTYSLTSYILVYNGAMAYTDTGFAGVTLTTPFNYVGTGNLQIMVVRSDAQTHPLALFYSANGNNLSATALTSRTYEGNTALSTSTTLTASEYRPALRLSYISPGAPPLCVPGFIPGSDEGDVATNQPVTWSTAVGAASYDVYFGSNSPAPFIINQTTTKYTPPALLTPNTAYYYNVIAKNASGSATGCDEFSFTTGSGYQYCFPNSIAGCGLADGITLVKLGTINNTSTCEGDIAYSDFTNLITNLTQGQSYSLTITQESDFDYVKTWIDFNDNGSFDDAGELVFGITGNVGKNISGNVSIAANAKTGIHLMRVRNSYDNANFNACEDQVYGESEDYLVNIIAPSTPDADLTDIAYSGCQGAGVVKITLKNSGNSPIAAGAASVKLYIKGANPQGPLTQANPAILAAGASVVLNFNATFNILGENIDSAFVTKIAGDPNAFNDSILTGHITAPIIAAPLAEDFENISTGVLPNGWSQTILSAVNFDGSFYPWHGYDTVIYPSYTPDEYDLFPKSGKTAMVFDSYDLEPGNAVRLTTSCVTIPATANTGCGYVAGLYFTQDPQFFYNNGIFYINDSIVVNISTNNGIYTRLGVLKRFDSTLSTPYETVPYSPPGWKLYTFDIGAYAGQTVQFAFDAYSDFGNQMAIDSFFIGPKTTAKNVALAGGNESDTTLTRAIVACDDKGWTYYHTANSADYLFGVQWDPSNTGANAAAKAVATAKLGVTPIWYAAEDPDNLKATYTMQRYWNVNLNGAALTGPVNVRFFYAKGELDSMNLAKTNFIANNPGTSDKGTTWFIKSSGAFNPYTDVTADGVANSTAITNTNSIASNINNILYAQFNNITNLTGGSATTSVGSATAITYTFTGTGNWNLAANWSNNTVPPTTLPAGSSIVINHSVGGQCVLNVSQTISAGASFTVFTGKNLIVPGQLNLQ